MDKVLENPLDFLIYVGVGKTIILACLIIFVFEYFYDKASLLNPGTQMGIGTCGFIGLIGFGLGIWNGTTGIAVCLLGGFLYSASYRFEERSRYHREMLSPAKAVGY